MPRKFVHKNFATQQTVIMHVYTNTGLFFKIFLLWQLYAIGLRLTFHNMDGDVSVDGVGLSTAEFDPSTKSSSEKRAQTIAYAQKCGRSAAIQNAFQKVPKLWIQTKIGRDQSQIFLGSGQ